MRAYGAARLIPLALPVFIGSCGSVGMVFTNPSIETRFSFVNFSRSAYAAIGVRDSSAASEDFAFSPLLPPGAIFRADFRELTQVGCPGSVDLRLLVYRRVNDTVPIGLDEGEAVEQTPSVAGEVLDVPACRVEPLVTYTVVNWDAPDGEARVKIAQGSAVEEQIRTSGIFPNVDAAWEIEGVAASLASAAPPAPLTTESISGRVTLPDGSGVAGVGVLLRTRFRVRLSDGDTSNDPDAGFSDPIAFTSTDESGAFSINRPAGGYQLEFFSDDLTFRPAAVTLETPIEVVQIIAEPL